MCDESPTKESQKIVGMKRTHLEMDLETSSSNGCLEASSSSSSNSPNNMCLNCSSSCVSSSSSGSSSGGSFIPNSSPDTTWKTMYEDEHTKNTMLNLQLCFVQSECVRLLNLQSDMASSIATLQVMAIPISNLTESLPFAIATHPLRTREFTELLDQLDRRRWQ